MSMGFMKDAKTQVWLAGVAYDITFDVAAGTAEVMTADHHWTGQFDLKGGAGNFSSPTQSYFNVQLQAAITDAINETEEVKVWREMEPKARALALHLGLDISEVDDEDPTFVVGRTTSYLVLTDEEADRQAKERAHDSLWAFNIGFLAQYVPALRNGRAQGAWEKVVGELCEDAGPLVEAMLGDRLDEFLTRAIEVDGRGHFLDGWDGGEQDCKDPITGQEFHVFRQ